MSISISPARWEAAKRGVLAKNASLVTVPKKATLSKAEQCANILVPKRGEKPFGCRTEYVAKICEIMIGEKVVLRSVGDYDFVPGSMVVLLRNPNDHDYTINDPIYVYKQDQGIMRTVMGKLVTGNSLPDRYDYEGERKPFRLATAAEIEAFFATTTPHYDRGVVDEEQVRKDLGL